MNSVETQQPQLFEIIGRDMIKTIFDFVWYMRPILRRVNRFFRDFFKGMGAPDLADIYPETIKKIRIDNSCRENKIKTAKYGYFDRSESYIIDFIAKLKLIDDYGQSSNFIFNENILSIKLLFNGYMTGGITPNFDYIYNIFLCKTKFILKSSEREFDYFSFCLYFNCNNAKNSAIEFINDSVAEENNIKHNLDTAKILCLFALPAIELLDYELSQIISDSLTKIFEIVTFQSDSSYKLICNILKTIMLYYTSNENAVVKLLNIFNSLGHHFRFLFKIDNDKNVFYEKNKMPKSISDIVSKWWLTEEVEN